MSDKTIKLKAEEKANKVRAAVRERGIASQPNDQGNSDASPKEPIIKTTPDAETSNADN